MRITKDYLKRLIKEEMVKEEPSLKYKARSIQTGEEKRYDGTRWYDEAIRVLNEAERKFRVLIGERTKNNPEKRDACLQEIAAKLESSNYGALDPLDLFKTIEKALSNTSDPEESDNGDN